MIVELNFAIKITLIMEFNITRSWIYTIVDKGISVNHDSLVFIFETAFDELKFNPTVVTY